MQVRRLRRTRSVCISTGYGDGCGRFFNLHFGSNQNCLVLCLLLVSWYGMAGAGGGKLIAQIIDACLSIHPWAR